MSKYLPTIGLEIHAELKTVTKMFCGCANDPDENHPNTNVCPVCLGHPGVLPVINKRAIELMIKIGMAVGGKINEKFKFDRKNYFYPDLAKGYQISQYDMPIVKGGNLDISSRLGREKTVKLNRVHLEEDAGKLVHSASFADQRRLDTRIDTDGIGENLCFDQRESASLVDFNRGGVPLMELVTEPDIHSVDEAVAFAKELQLILRYLGASEADLERGQMRFDLNISLSEIRRSTQIVTQINADNISINPRVDQRKSASTLGTKVEVKNLNSFASLEVAIKYEIERQSELLDSSKEIKQETRGWDVVKQRTVSQRSKEEAHDYRYFPEPDLPMLDCSGFDIKTLELEIPELPDEKRIRFKKQFNLSGEQVNILVADRFESDFFEKVVSELEVDTGKEIDSQKIQLLFNYLNSDLKGFMGDEGMDFTSIKIKPENFADLIEMISQNKISSRIAKDLIPKMQESGIDPETLVINEGLSQVSSESELISTVKKIIESNPVAVGDYKKGKSNALQFLIGKAMAELRGRGNPAILKELFEKKLK